MNEQPAPFGQRTVTADAVARFGELTGDYARIHHDHHLGRATPAGRGFAHGLLSASWALGAITQHAPARVGGDDPRAYVGAFSCRFGAITHFDDTLGFEVGEASSEPHGSATLTTTPFVCSSQDGVPVTTGSVGRVDLEAGARPIAWPREPLPHPPIDAAPAPDQWSGEDIVAFAPRGLSRGRTLGEADVARWTQSTGDVSTLHGH